LKALNLQTSRYTRMSFESAERRQESARAWKALLNAMRQGKEELAQKLASSQSLSTRDAALRALRAANEGSVKQPSRKTARTKQQ
jgi:hypothetical protein